MARDALERRYQRLRMKALDALEGYGAYYNTNQILKDYVLERGFDGPDALYQKLREAEDGPGLAKVVEAIVATCKTNMMALHAHASAYDIELPDLAAKQEEKAWPKLGLDDDLEENLTPDEQLETPQTQEQSTGWTRGQVFGLGMFCSLAAAGAAFGIVYGDVVSQGATHAHALSQAGIVAGVIFGLGMMISTIATAKTKSPQQDNAQKQDPDSADMRLM